jgi:hypothetical protein
MDVDLDVMTKKDNSERWIPETSDTGDGNNDS